MQEESKPDFVDVSSDDDEKRVRAPKEKNKQADKKRKFLSSAPKTKAVKKPKKKKGPTNVTVSVRKPVSLDLAVKELVKFTKATPLSAYVNLRAKARAPLMVEYPFDSGHIQYYLATKIDVEDVDG